jgi:hypothetical protein
MTRTTRVSIQILPILVAGYFAGVGCSSNADNNAPAYATTGGSISATGGSPSNAGTPSTTGGTSSTAGTTASGGSSAGASSACAAPGFFVDGQCGSTTANPPVAIAKNVACTDADQQLCDKTCGPGNSGFKTETCTAGVYAESSTCTFPASCQFGCFKVPTADAAGCPATPPQHNQPCSLAICNLPCAQDTPCEMCGVAAGYLDSGGAAKVGYCVCIPAAAGGGKWACATFPQAWPCPAGLGC